jgi:hypothetical protein
VSNAVLIGLIVFLVAALLGLALALVRGLAAWRAYRGFRRTALVGMNDLNRRLTALQVRADALPRKGERLAEAREALEESIAEARVIADAFDEAAAALQAVRGLPALR